MNRRAIQASLAAFALLAAGLTVNAPTASAVVTAGPTLTFSTSKITRGVYGILTASGLTVGTQYTETSDSGSFDSSGTHTRTFTATATTSDSAAFTLLASNPATTVHAALTIAGDSTELSAVDIQVAAPTITLAAFAQPCPGRASTIAGQGFAAGTYVITSDSGTASNVQTTTGGFQTPLTLANTASHQFTVSATPTGGTTPAASAVLALSAGRLALGQFTDPWSGSITGSCFGPGEQVSLTVSGGLSLPDTLTAGPSGTIYSTTVNRPNALVNLPITLTATGQTSHQQATLNSYDVARASLPSGSVLSGSGFGAVLASSTPGYQFEPNSCTAPIYHQVPDGVQISWSALPSDLSVTAPTSCYLIMQSDGNAVLRDPAGSAIWASNTAVPGSHLDLRDDGSLRVVTPTGVTVWTSAISPSYAYIASSRVRSAVYINGLIKQRYPTAQIIRGANRTVYLQRFNGGGWQNVLSRVTDGGGQLAVGFIQAKPFAYRLVVLATPGVAGAVSASTTR